MKSVDWLGYRLEEGTLRPTAEERGEDQSRSLSPRKPPRTVSDCSSRILGVLNYYRAVCKPPFFDHCGTHHEVDEDGGKQNVDNLIEWG